MVLSDILLSDVLAVGQWTRGMTAAAKQRFAEQRQLLQVHPASHRTPLGSQILVVADKSR